MLQNRISDTITHVILDTIHGIVVSNIHQQLDFGLKFSQGTVTYSP